MTAKLAKVKAELTRRRHLPRPRAGPMAGQRGQRAQAYYAVPGNGEAVRAFRTR